MISHFDAQKYDTAEACSILDKKDQCSEKGRILWHGGTVIGNLCRFCVTRLDKENRSDL